MITAHLVWRLCEDSLLPEVWGQVAVGPGDGIKGGLGCKSRRGTRSLCIPSTGRRCPLIYAELHRNTAKLRHLLTKVPQRGRASSGRGVAVIDTRHHEQLLGDRSRHDAGTARSRDQAHQYGATAAGHLHRTTRSVKRGPHMCERLQAHMPRSDSARTLQGTVCGFPILFPQ